MRSPLLVLLVLFSINALAGPGHSGGGGGAKADFLKMARYLERETRVFGAALGLPLAPELLREKLEKLTLLPVDGPLLLDGQKVDAINHPATVTIELDGDAWLANDLRTRYQIVVHETLGLLEVPDRKEQAGSEYQLSEEIAARTFPLDESFEIDPRDEKCDLLSARSSQLSTALAKCGLVPKTGACARVRDQEDAVHRLYRAEGCRLQLRIRIRL